MMGPLALVLVGSLALVGPGLGSNFLVTLLDSGWPLALVGLECLLLRLCPPTLSVRPLALVGALALSMLLELLLLVRRLDVE